MLRAKMLVKSYFKKATTHPVLGLALIVLGHGHLKVHELIGRWRWMRLTAFLGWT